MEEYMNLALMQPAQRLHEIQTSEHIKVSDFLEQITFLYRNVPNKDKYYIKMMNKYDYLGHAAHSEMVRLDKLIQRNYAEWYLHSERENIYITQRPDILDLYHSLNLYGSKKVEGSKRKIAMDTDNIEMLIGLMIDIDVNESIFSNLEIHQLYEFLIEEKVIGEVIPNVNALVYSGKGLHLLIKFKYPVPATEKTKKLVEGMQDCFRKELQEHLVIKGKNKYKTDTLSLITSTRVNTSYNSKNFEKVKFTIVNDEFLELNELQKIYDKIKPYSRKKNQPQKVFHLGLSKKTTSPQKTYMMLQDRKNDLKKLQEKYQEHCKDYEEKICFLYCNFSIQQLIHNYIATELKGEVSFNDIELTKQQMKNFFDIAFEETVEFNSNFEKPYKPRQMRSKMNILTKKTYKFTTVKIIQWLNIPEEIQYNLKMTLTKEVSDRRKKDRSKRRAAEYKVLRRNENGLTKREQDKQDLIEQIKKLKEQGYTQKKVAGIVKKSERTVKRHWNI